MRNCTFSELCITPSLSIMHILKSNKIAKGIFFQKYYNIIYQPLLIQPLNHFISSQNNSYFGLFDSITYGQRAHPVEPNLTSASAAFLMMYFLIFFYFQLSGHTGTSIFFMQKIKLYRYTWKIMQTFISKLNAQQGFYFLIN